MSRKKKVTVINFPSELYSPTWFPQPPPPPPDVFPNYPPPYSTSATPMPPPSMPKTTNSSRRWLPFFFLASGAYIFMNSRRQSTEARKANLEDSNIPVQTEARKANLEDSYIPVQSGDATTSSEEDLQGGMLGTWEEDL